jgi:predicted RNA-binding protein YlxR (DUF448 family)
MAYERIKSEHARAKNGGGAWITRDEAKQAAKRQRRQADKAATQIVAQQEEEAETHGELTSYLDEEVPSTEQREDHWAATNAREAIREEQW